MLRDIQIEGFRGFTQLSFSSLARINVLVGANNAGKTAALEAIELLIRGPDSSAIANLLRRREEYLMERHKSDDFPFDVRGLFNGRRPTIGSAFRLSSSAGQRFHCLLRPLDNEEISGLGPSGRVDKHQPWLFSEEEQLDLLDAFGPALGLEIDTERGSALLPMNRRYAARRIYDESVNNAVSYLGTSLQEPELLAALWDQVALTDRESQVVSALQIIEPSVSRVAVLGSPNRRPNVFLKVDGAPNRIPLGSMGEGIRRLLALALIIGNTPSGGFILIDEVDTGLHHTVMRKMWQLLINAAVRFNHQVFATTHSLDCILALAHFTNSQPRFEGEISVHRIERNRPRATRYSGTELEIAIRNELEIR